MKKTATVVGLGISGAGAARLLAKKGWEVRVTEGIDAPEIRDKARPLKERWNIKLELGRHTKDFVEGAELVVASPGVKDDSAPLVWARQLGIPVIDEIELGYRFCPARIVAVTGTNGKSTTATLVGEILKAAGLDVVVCGNIGLSFCERLPAVKKEGIVVLEVSSFQLQRIVKFRPYVSVFLNITQNHLDRHKDFREYLNAKLNIFRNQKIADWAVLNYEDKNLKYLKKHIKPRILYFGSSSDIKGACPVRYHRPNVTAHGVSNGACLEDNIIYLVNNKKISRFLPSQELALQGEHNIRNAMAAALVGNIFKINAATIKEVLRRFKGLEHRCEYVAEIDGREFINDSKATTVDAAMWAIRSLNKPVVLIAGGRDKGGDFTILKPLIEKRVKAVVLIGEAKKRLRVQLMGSAQLHEAEDLDSAVAMGFNLANRGEAVLLSPMCASFDMFKNFEERGERFKKAVALLKTQINTDKRRRLTQINLCSSVRT